jgi:hypothetical protein
METDRFQPKLGRIRGSKNRANLRTTVKVFRHAGKAGARAVLVRGHVSPSSLRRGMGTGALAAAGLLAPGSRRVIVRARIPASEQGISAPREPTCATFCVMASRVKGCPGASYDATSDHTDLEAFLKRSGGDPYQFRFIVSAEDSARLRDLKPFIRDLMSHVEQDLGSNSIGSPSTTSIRVIPTATLSFGVETKVGRSSSLPATTSATACVPVRRRWSPLNWGPRQSWSALPSS